jgi:hypothetical protein
VRFCGSFARFPPLRRISGGIFREFATAFTSKASTISPAAIRLSIARSFYQRWRRADRQRAESAGLLILKAVRKLTSLPIRFLVNTETHNDYTTGNFVFSPPAVVIGAAEAPPE